MVLFFLLGALLTAAGIQGQGAYQHSGIQSSSGSEDGYSVIYALSGEVKTAWSNAIKPDLDALSTEDRAVLTAIAEEALRAKWESMKAGGGDEAAAVVAKAVGRETEMTWKLLYMTWPLEGPSVSRSSRLALTSLPGAELKAFRQEILRCLLDEGRAVPEAAREIVEKAAKEKREDTLLQLFFISGGSADGSFSAHMDWLKKSIRGKEQKLTAYSMASQGELTWLWQMTVSYSRTICLVGIVLMADVLLLLGLMMSQHSWNMDVKWVLILAILDFLLIFQALPSIHLIKNAFTPNGAFSLDTFRSLYTNPDNLNALKNTLISAFAAMILGTLIAFPLAWLVGRTNLYGRKLFRTLFVTTYMVPPYVGAMAWMRLLNPNVGTINQALRALMGLAADTGPLNIYTMGGMIWVLTTFYYPYAFITISRAMEKMDPSLEEASRISGASPLKTVFTITLPMMMPSLVAGALLVFISAASCYGIPSITGKQGGIFTVTTRIADQVQLKDGMNNAAGLGVFLMLLGLVILFISDVILARKQFTTVSGKSVRPSIVDLRGARIPLSILTALFAILVVVVPFSAILTTSFKIDVGKSMLATSNFTLDNWRDIFTREKNLISLRNSLVYASAAATAGLVIACVMSYLLQRTRIRGRSIPNFLITLGSGMPSVVIALSLMISMRGDFGISIIGTAHILIIAYLIKYEMMGMRTVTSAMSQIHVSLEECSQISGASWLTTMRRVTGPLIFPSIAAGWFLIFIPSFYELSMTELLFASGTETIGHQLFEYWEIHSQPMSCAMAFGILLIVILLNGLLRLLTRGKFSI